MTVACWNSFSIWRRSLLIEVALSRRGKGEGLNISHVNTIALVEPEGQSAAYIFFKQVQVDTLHTYLATALAGGVATSFNIIFKIPGRTRGPQEDRRMALRSTFPSYTWRQGFNSQPTRSGTVLRSTKPNGSKAYTCVYRSIALENAPGGVRR